MEDGLASTVNCMADALSRHELRTLHFLCSDLLPNSRVEDLRGALISLAQATGNSHSTRMILMELMFHLKRFDILKKLLGTSRQEVESMMESRRVLSGYRVLMVDLSADLGKDELHSLVFLLSGRLPRVKLESASQEASHQTDLSLQSFLDVVTELEKLDDVSPEKLDLIEQGFQDIQRVDLVRKIQRFQKKGTPRKHLDHNPETKRGVCSPTSPPPRLTVCPIVQNKRPSLASKGLKMSVAETGVHCQQAPEEYIMETNPRGVCVIIDCVGCDGDMLKQTFQHLGFKVILHTLLCLVDTHSVLRVLSQSPDLQKSSAFICCLLSRGSETHIVATESRGPGLSLVAVRQLFDAQSCPALKGKPKLFFVQIYAIQEAHVGSSQMDQCLETDGWGPSGCSNWQTDAVKTIPVSADVLSSVCMTDAQLLDRRGHQSVYWEVMRSTLLRFHGRRIPLLDALTEVNREVCEYSPRNTHESYSISLSHTLRKTLYL